jgi:hypothetical protein
MDEDKDKQLKLDIKDAIDYIVEKRDDAIEHLSNQIKINHAYPERLHSFLDTIVRMNKQIKTLEDCLVMLRVLRENQK